MKELKLYNTMTRQVMPFEPIDPAEVKLYTCGPTVYNYAHIGNLRTYIFEDLLRRVLEFNGYVVNHVMNITDVGHLTSDADEGEDKMLKGARREKKTVWEIAEYYTHAFMHDMVALNMLEPHIKCKATDHIQEMIDQVKALEDNGLTYTANGNVYFDTQKLHDYGKLAQLEKQKLQAGARIKVDKNKKSPYDFVLWFTKSKFLNKNENAVGTAFGPEGSGPEREPAERAEGEDQTMQWDSPWGRGYPGWHIECSAMSTRYLGEQFDIHCGGIDHIPVHHTNELAQAEGATNVKPWVNYWLHGNFLILGKDEKMAKSEENFLKLALLVEKGYDPLAYRYFCLQAHYRKELTFSWEALSAAKTALRRLKEKVCALRDSEGVISESAKTLSRPYIEEFENAINDDLNMPEALALTWKLVDDSELSEADKLATVREFDKVLGLKLDEKVKITISESVQELIIKRNEAREQKNWGKSDKLRDQIEAAGYHVLDGAGGTEVKPK